MHGNERRDNLVGLVDGRSPGEALRWQVRTIPDGTATHHRHHTSIWVVFRPDLDRSRYELSIHLLFIFFVLKNEEDNLLTFLRGNILQSTVKPGRKVTPDENLQDLLLFFQVLIRCTRYSTVWSKRTVRKRSSRGSREAPVLKTCLYHPTI